LESPQHKTFKNAAVNVGGVWRIEKAGLNPPSSWYLQHEVRKHGGLENTAVNFSGVWYVEKAR
jgi:hypothetical protein